MRYASVCSGVEAASLAWGKLGWTPVFFAEVEPFPCAVLQQRFDATKPLHPLDPAEASDEKDRKMRESWLKQINKLPDTGIIPNLGDFTKIKGEDYVGAIDLLVGGTPCFPAGNLVLTDFGYKPIEDIKVGDRVLSHTGKLNTCHDVRFRQVFHTFSEAVDCLSLHPYIMERLKMQGAVAFLDKAFNVMEPDELTLMVDAKTMEMMR